MLSYSSEEIKEIISDILKSRDFNVSPVGNHHLKRHLVYAIEFVNGEKYIFKLYYIDRRRSRELASLRELEKCDIKCPTIHCHGVLNDGTEWLITKHIEGELLDGVLADMSKQEKLHIFEELGEELGKLHSYKTFDFFGEWDEEGRALNVVTSYHDYFRGTIEKAIEMTLSQEMPDKAIIQRAIEEIRNSYDLLNFDIVPRLIHNDFDGRNILVKKVKGRYTLSGIVDFEGGYPGNSEEDLVGLYYRYFYYNRSFEEAFFKGYRRFLEIDPGFKKRLRFYMLCFCVENCSWAFEHVRDYYEDNVRFLYKLIDNGFDRQE